MSGSDYSDILFDQSGGVARIRFNRPHARNSLTDHTTAEFYDAVSRVARDDGVRVLLIRGNGPDFCPGADVKAYHSDPSVQAAQESAGAEAFRATVLLHEMSPVTIAAIQGGCAGAGFGWACACDVRVADTGARFNTAFLAVGVAGDMAVPWSLPRIVGAGRARDLSFFPRKFDGRAAHDIGLVTRLFEPEQFEAELDAMLSQLGGAAPLALKALKSNYLEAERLSLASYVSVETERHLALFSTHDRVEAFAAFAEKRPPVFRGC